MTLEEIQAVVNEVLREHLAKYGFREATVKFALGVDGEEILDIASYIYSGHEKMNPRASIHAISALRAALIRAGEDRFPVVFHRFPETEAA